VSEIEREPSAMPAVELSVVAPCFRESEGVSAFVEAIAPVLSACAASWEVILVDDGSDDDTWNVIERVVAEHSGEVRGLRLSRNFGKEAALIAGLEASRGAAVITIDADLQHPVGVIPEMVELWRGGAQVVDGVKRTRTGQSAIHRAVSTVFNVVFTRLTAVDLNRATDFKLLDRVAVDAFGTLREHNNFYRGTSQWIGFERRSVEFDVDGRHAGSSRFTITGLARLALRALTSFTAAPLHLVTLSGLAFGVFALVLAVQTLVRFFTGEAVEGFTTIILILLILGSLILTGLGVIGEYIARIHDEVKARPRYIVSKRV
jgi:glycosyltransferase involved in cell wall biosynthesis